VIDPLDHALFVILAVLLGPRAYLSMRRIKVAPPDELPAIRLRGYRLAMISQWVLVAILIAHWVYNRRAWGWLGLVPVMSWGALGVVAGLAIVLSVMAVRGRSAGSREEQRARMRERLRSFEYLLPHSARELRVFLALAVTAGICEELLFRGFMIWYLGHWLGLFQAAALASLVFGLGHLYQGPRGILTTALVGAFLSAVYLLSGSIFLPVAIHALIDVNAGVAGHGAFAEEGSGAAVAEPRAEEGATRA
jgi:membrane protease YdiL (CAAX protease family)